MSAQFARVPLAVLTVGSILTTPIFDPNRPGTKLLGENVEINEQFLRQLAERGIDSVVVSQRDLAAIHSGSPQGARIKVSDHDYQATSFESELSRKLDNDIGAMDLPASDTTGTKSHPVVERTDRYDANTVSQAVKQRETRISYVEELFTNLVTQGAASSENIEGVCRQSIKSVIDDKDLFLCLGLNPYHTEYPARHSLHVCSLAISIGVMLGLDDQSLIDLGTGCLIHDVGMLKLDEKLYKTKRQLASEELAVLADHPILTLDALACPGVRISRVARVIAYQIHERCDGSGYPRGRVAEEIHYLAKIAAVADAYVALVSNRTHRRGMIPYYAMEKILNDVSLGLFDPKVVRGLLQTISLFPIGSFVEMTTGQVGRVVRSTGETYTQPIVELWDDAHQQFAPELINLADESNIKISKAASSPMAD